MKAIVEQIVQRTSRGEAVSLCTVVAARGSTPQQAGAAMLVLQDGQTLGTLGGGCVEAEVRTQALRLLGRREDRLLSFKLDHDYAGWDDGLVCGGTMEIAVQTLAAAEPWIALQSELAANRETGLDVAVPDESSRVCRFRIPIEPTPTLLIAGAGHVGQALAALVAKLDFEVVVIDDRPDCVTAERFPTARRIVGDIEAELRRFAISGHTYVVVLTRGHKHDAQALGAVIESSARYVGLIGSKRKVLQILRGLKEQGVSDERLARVHAPIGLAIGAVSPAEIAVSIAAELIAVRRGRAAEPIPSMKLAARHLG